MVYKLTSHFIRNTGTHSCNYPLSHNVAAVEVAWLLVLDRLVWVFQKLLMSWDFHTRQPQGFTLNSVRNTKNICWWAVLLVKKHPVGKRRQRWLVRLTGRLRSLKHYTLQTQKNINLWTYNTPKTWGRCSTRTDYCYLTCASLYGQNLSYCNSSYKLRSTPNLVLWTWR